MNIKSLRRYIRCFASVQPLARTLRRHPQLHSMSVETSKAALEASPQRFCWTWSEAKQSAERDPSTF